LAVYRDGTFKTLANRPESGLAALDDGSVIWRLPREWRASRMMQSFFLRIPMLLPQCDRAGGRSKWCVWYGTTEGVWEIRDGRKLARD
jgi:hypothetical protein